MGGLNLVCSLFYWMFSVEVFDFLNKLLPSLDKANLEISVWSLIILTATSVIAALTLNICFFGISDSRFNQEAVNNCFN